MNFRKALTAGIVTLGLAMPAEAQKSASGDKIASSDISAQVKELVVLE